MVVDVRLRRRFQLPRRTAEAGLSAPTPNRTMNAGLPRRVEDELLDTLAVDDPRAQRSRADLRRIHRAMATLPILLRAVDRGTAGTAPRTMLELGAGDGSLMLRVARQRASRWPGVRITLMTG